MTTLHYLASDFFIWYSHEFGMVEPADEHSGSSSIMPQKKNPRCGSTPVSRPAMPPDGPALPSRR